MQLACCNGISKLLYLKRLAATAARRVVQLVIQPPTHHPYFRSGCSVIKFRVHPAASSSLPLFVHKTYVSEVPIRMARSVAWNNALRRLDTRNTSQLVKSNEKRAFLVHTLPLSEMMQESAFSKFKKRMQSSQATNAGIRIEASTESRGGCNIIPLSSLILSKQQLFQGFTVRPAAWYKASMTPYLHFGGHHFSVFFRAISTAPTAEDSQVEGGLSRVNDPTHEVAPRIKFKRLSKTAKHIMQILDVEAVQEVKAQREIPNIKPGHIVQLKVEVPENKRRVSVIKGIVIARRNAGLNTTVRIRRLVAGVGVESVFPLYSPNIKEIKVLDQKEVRRAKLYYLRDRMASADRK